MAEIAASHGKELRERTGAGMMDCKALTEANGDIELAIENVNEVRRYQQRKAGVAAAA